MTSELENKDVDFLEGKTAKEAYDLGQVTALFLQYAASVHDSEDFVSGKVSPGDAVEEFITAFPKYAPFRDDLTMSFDRKSFVTLIDQLQNDGDQFLRYDINEVADRTAPSVDIANANPYANHYDEISALQPTSVFGAGTSQILANRSAVHKVVQPTNTNTNEKKVTR
jgi:hypothetical protein